MPLLHTGMQYFYLIIFILFTSCSSKKEQQQSNAVRSIKEMGELATVEYTVTKIIKASDNKTWFKIGDRKILMTCEAVIKAGIDLSSVNENNFTINGKDVSVTLPPPKVISLSIPPEKIVTQYVEVGQFRTPFTNKERDALAAQAEVQIRNSIDSLGILLQAKVNTGMLITNLLKQLGYENITIIYSDGKQIPVLQ